MIAHDTYARGVQMADFAQFVTFGKSPLSLYTRTPWTPFGPNQAQFPMDNQTIDLFELDRSRDAVLEFRLRLWGSVHLTMDFNGQATPFLDYTISQAIPGMPQVWNEIISGSSEVFNILNRQNNQLTITVEPVAGIFGIPFPGRVELSQFVLFYHASDPPKPNQ